MLSKSTYIRGLQCLKSLYLHKNRYYLRDPISPEQLAKFQRGHDIGKLAQQLFPNGVELSRPSKASAKKTAELMAKEIPVLYEACFVFDDVICAIDILVKTENGWNAYEVKSSRALSETYFNDAFLQHYVITNSGLALNDFQLVYVNAEAAEAGETDLQQLFLFQSVIEEARTKTTWIAQNIEAMKQVVLLPHMPEIEMGEQCTNPYPCDFQGFCNKKR